MNDGWQVPEHKDPRVFRHSHDGPEAINRGRRWPKSKCKRNKGQPHEYVLDLERHPKYGSREWRDRWRYRRQHETMHRAYRGQERSVYYTCKHCGKEETVWEWRDEPATPAWTPMPQRA